MNIAIWNGYRTMENSLPEILHKTAVTTIRSTAEKQAASRERAKLRSEETKKRQAASSVTKRETSKGKLDFSYLSNSKLIQKSCFILFVYF